MFNWYNEVRWLNEISLSKYRAELRIRKPEEYNIAKKRIKQLHLELHAMQKRVKHFNELLSLNPREQENMSISSRVIVSMRSSLQKKYDTYKGGIKEITKIYGFKNTSFKKQL